MKTRLVIAVSHNEMKWISVGMSRSHILVMSGPRIPAYGPASVPGGEGMMLAVGWDPRAAASVFVAGIEGNWLEESGPRIPAYGPVLCPRGGRHNSCHGLGSSGRPDRVTVCEQRSELHQRTATVLQIDENHAISRCAGFEVLAVRGSRPMDRFHAPGGEGMMLVVGRDLRAARLTIVKSVHREAVRGTRPISWLHVPGGENVGLPVGRVPRAASPINQTIETWPTKRRSAGPGLWGNFTSPGGKT